MPIVEINREVKPVYTIELPEAERSVATISRNGIAVGIRNVSMRSLIVPIHQVHRFSTIVDVSAIVLPAVSSASSSSSRSPYEPGSPSDGDLRLSTTPTEASTSFWASLSLLPYACERGLMGLPRSSYSWM